MSQPPNRSVDKPLKTKSEPANGSSNWLEELKSQGHTARNRAFIISFFINMFTIATSIFVLQVYDKVVYLRGLDTLVALVMGMAVVLLFDFIMRRIRSDLMRSIASHSDIFGASRLFKHIFSLPLLVLESRSAERWSQLFRDLGLVRNRLSGPAAVAQMDFPFAFVMLVLIFVIARPVFLIPIVFTVVILVLLWRSEKTLQKRVAAEEIVQRRRQGSLFDIISARLTIKNHQMQSAAFERWARHQAETIDKSIDRGNSNDFYETCSHTVSQLSSVTLVAVGAVAIVDGQMTIGSLIAANILSSRAIATIAKLISHWRAYRESREAEKRLDDVYAVGADQTRGILKISKPKGDIKLENVDFSYPGMIRPAVQKVTCVLPKGRITAIIGANGSGKSSLLKLMRGLYRPHKGRALIDDHDLQQFGQVELSNWISYLPQENALITGSIYDNIVFGLDPLPSDDQVVAAARMAGSHNVIVDLPNGYGEKITDNGSNISPGFKQKLALTRVFVRDSAAILLDEPTNHLDNESLTQLIETLSVLKSDKSVVLVSHHVTLLRAAQFIVMLDKGRIIRSGPPARILSGVSYGNLKPVKAS